MSKDRKDPSKFSEAYKRGAEAQLARLLKQLRHDHFAAVSELPYMARLGAEKWHKVEKDRVEEWFGGTYEVDHKVLELSKILNAAKPDRQACIKWMENNKDNLTADQLMQLISETRLVAVSDSMRQINKKRDAKTSEKFRKIGWRWLEYEAGLVDGIKHSKNSAAPLMENEFDISEERIRKYYLIKIEENTEVFPDGVAAARKKLGILHD